MAGILPPWNPKALRPLSQVSLRVNKRSHWSFLTPLKPIVTSPISAATQHWNWHYSEGLNHIHPSDHPVSSQHTPLYEPYMSQSLHWHPPCERQSYASSGEPLCKLFRHNHCTDMTPVRNNRMTLQETLLVNSWCATPTLKTVFNLDMEPQKLGWT